MPKEYDLVVVGAGPAGLMATKTAGENGLNVALIERKGRITDINRSCSMMLVSLGGEYLGERILLNKRAKRLCFPRYGFSIPYEGPHQDFYTWSIYSHRANKIQLGDYQENSSKGEAGRASAVYDKEVLLKGLLKEVESLNADVFPSHNVIGTATDGGKVKVITSEGKSFKGTFVIAADGRSSRLAQTLGFNRKRKFFGTPISLGFEMLGLEPPEKYALFQILLNESHPVNVWITPRTGKDEHFVMISSLTPDTDYAAAFERFSRKGFFSPWFERAEIKRKLSSIGNMCSHIVDPYKDQVMLVSDAAWCQEAEMTGAIISGWKAASAVTCALTEGKVSREGVSNYLDWWREEVINKYDYRDMIRNAVLPYLLTPDEIDFIFSLIKKPLPNIFDPYETPKLIGGALSEVMPVIAKEKPRIIKKLNQMRSTPLEKIFEGCIRAGFPFRPH
ncbi:MAG: NAD(P)/FAD-dependent oxidoreductase [Deltaproteobacteria bacterium]|jgi:digeranylgeranylglycerophospholipid reductase|nr:NAD(P)/FAD-dependent oxidoreductase [Deltaproteobacteria bacterium]MBW2553653.1 NAD(P)/FAD-dependent oxidoreductase [Deltaproteobacteria bacterium]